MQVQPTAPGTGYPLNPTTEDLVQKFSTIYQQLKERLTEVQAKYKEYYDRNIKEAPQFKPTDLI
jgi:hypothetical protein